MWLCSLAPYPVGVPTRTLILIAVITGLVILVAFTVLVLTDPMFAG
jgi:hypothetical protein